jgi:putative flippase GtrA
VKPPEGLSGRVIDAPGLPSGPDAPLPGNGSQDSAPRLRAPAETRSAPQRVNRATGWSYRLPSKRPAGTGNVDLRALLQRFISPRFIQFAVVGFSGVFINLGALFAFADVLKFNDVLSSAVAIEISIVWNFLLNNTWTFQDRVENASTGFTLRMVRYNLVSLVGLAIQLGAYYLITRSLIRTMTLTEPGWWKYPAQLGGIALAMAWNYLSNFHWTWAQKTPTDEDAP